MLFPLRFRLRFFGKIRNVVFATNQNNRMFRTFQMFAKFSPEVQKIHKICENCKIIVKKWKIFAKCETFFLFYNFYIEFCNSLKTSSAASIGNHPLKSPQVVDLESAKKIHAGATVFILHTYL